MIYIGKLSAQLYSKFQKLCNQYCKEKNIKTVFAYFKIVNFYTVWDPSSQHLKSVLVYNFKSGKCYSCYVPFTHAYVIMKTILVFFLWVFSISDTAQTTNSLKIKDVMCGNWKEPNFESQV